LVGLGTASLEIRDPSDRLRELLRLELDFRALLAVDVGDGPQHRGKAGDAVAVARRKIGAREERSLLGGEEHRERPAPRSAHQLHDQLVDLIEVGSLFAVDFDRHEMFVHEARDLLVFERLPLHDVTPVASRVPDG
jgi:hypothetical protein